MFCKLQEVQVRPQLMLCIFVTVTLRVNIMLGNANVESKYQLFRYLIWVVRRDMEIQQQSYSRKKSVL